MRSFRCCLVKHKLKKSCLFLRPPIRFSWRRNPSLSVSRLFLSKEAAEVDVFILENLDIQTPPGFSVGAPPSSALSRAKSNLPSWLNARRGGRFRRGAGGICLKSAQSIYKAEPSSKAFPMIPLPRDGGFSRKGDRLRQAPTALQS